MKVLHNRIVVRFDETDKKLFNVGGVELYRPDEWLHKSEEGKTTYAENTNYLETKPQIATVVYENHSPKLDGYGIPIPNTRKYLYKTGDKVFLHYMAHTTSTYAIEETKDAFVFADYIFFTFNEDGTYKMAEGVYFGEQIYSEDEKTPNGIIINVLGHKPKLCQIKLTHVPDGSEFKVGDVILTVDSYQYPANVDGKDYVMVRESEISGRV